MQYKPDWSRARERLVAWWGGRGLAVAVMAPRRDPTGAPAPPRPANLSTLWLDPEYRLAAAEHHLGATYFGGEAFPYFDTQIGPGSLGLILGAQAVLDPATIWYRPCLPDPPDDRPILLRREGNRWLEAHLALIRAGVTASGGRYLTGVPDIIEGLDTLAALRGTQRLMIDLLERPAWVHNRLADLASAYEEVFELLAEPVRDEHGGNAYAAFRIWGPGRTAKIQCDLACMLSPALFREFFVPYATAQCAWLDYSMFHLDGPDALRHVDALCEIPGLNAVQWTPGSGQPGAGDPCWYELFRRLKAGGKAVQVIGPTPREIEPLLEAIGPSGTFIVAWCGDQDTAEQILELTDRYR